jgi:hypothetical protein
VTSNSSKKQVIEVVVERLSEKFYSLYFRKEKDKMVQPYVAPLLNVYKEGTKVKLYDSFRLLGVYTRRDSTRPDGRKLADPNGSSSLYYRQFLGRLKEEDAEDKFDVIFKNAVKWFNGIAEQKHTPDNNTTFRFPATVVFGDNVSTVPFRPVGDVLCNEDAIEVLLASYGGGTMTLQDFVPHQELLVDFFGSVQAAEAAFGFSFTANDSSVNYASLPQDPFDDLEPLA